MHPQSHAHAGDSAIEQAAGEWLARLDRGLAPEEAVEFAEWEAADPRHRVQLERLKATWRALDTADEVPEIMRLVQEMEQSQRQRARWRRPKIALVGLGMAAALTLAWIGWSRLGRASATFARSENRAYQIVPSSGQRLTLVDGTVVEFSADSAVEPAFTAQERRVRLVRGEAHFSVVRDAARPFIVQAGTVAVRAVGTAFNVRLDPATVEVLVTEGKVRVDDAVKGESLLARKSPGATRTTPEPPVLRAGERVVIMVAPSGLAAPVVATPADLERILAWQGTRLIFERTPLADAVAAFNSFNRLQLVIGDASLQSRKLGGSFRADNIDAFVRLLETGFDITAERRAGDVIVLRSAR